MTLPAWTPRFADRPLCGAVAHWAPRFADCAQWPDAERLDRLAAEAGLANAAGLPVRFEAQLAGCGQRQYEGQILDTGRVPTRPGNWHDLFNALVWLTFPSTKAALNAVQCRELQGAAKGRRTPASDAATLFDESGLLLVARDDTLANLLRAKRWKDAFWSHRADWAAARFYVVGHAVLEKALAPYPGMTGKCLFLQVDTLPEAGAPPPAWLDAKVARVWLEGRVGRPADLFVLPVLGVPGLCAENAEAGYYDNTAVFRPPRTGQAGAGA